jgi:subtilisin family serine protease
LFATGNLAKTGSSLQGLWVTRRPFVFGIAAALAALAGIASAANAASVQCAPKPASPVGYQLAAVGGDRVEAPAATAPIAILDTGVSEVPELQGRLLPGYNVTNRSAKTNDIDGHGTAVAAVAAASGGVRGVSPTSPIIPIKIFDDRGDSTAEDFIAGIERAVGLGAGVINISGAGSAADVDPATKRAVQDAIFNAVSRGIPVIAPTGNEGGSKLDVPAAYPHVIAVGATDEAGAPASFSNSGSGVDLVAPGSSITTSAPSFLCSSGYGTVSGTSFSAPAVAGAAALLLQIHPGLDALQLTDMLRLHGIRTPAPGWNVDTGFGMLDVPAALGAAVPAADQREVDDTVSWANRHAPVLTPSKRSRTLTARVATHSDPADVFRVRLKKGDRFRATLRGSGVTLGFGDRSRKLKQGRIKKAGTYYVTVTAQPTVAAGGDYRLTLRR